MELSKNYIIILIELQDVLRLLSLDVTLKTYTTHSANSLRIKRTIRKCSQGK